MFIPFLSLAVQGEPIVLSREPRPATPWTETFSATCGEQKLEIRRPMRPLEDGPEILINGGSAQGDLESLKLELSEVGAAYRMSILCTQDGEFLQLLWVRGLLGEDGQVHYRSGNAAFRDGALFAS